MLSPIEYPKKYIIFAGMNYLDYKEEVELASKNNFSKEVDTIFSKRDNKI